MATAVEVLRRSRVVLVGDNTPMRAALRGHLHHYADDTAVVVGEASGGWTALREAALKRADVVVVDVSIPDEASWAFVRRLHLMVPKACIIAACPEPHGNVARQMKELGVCQLLDRTHVMTELLPAIWKCTGRYSSLSPIPPVPR
ncbi:MAG: hypothetical protein HY681_11990 [Chloroflexi bacterium]|nr:hypothetical protein [Chloroflexota bacterium]